MIWRNITLIIVLSILNLGCNGDYDEDLGNGYHLVRTNACCIFVFKQDVNPIIIGNKTIYDTRIVKPVVKELYIDDKYIVGLKISNECCYLDVYEKKHNTPNGYFIINKKSGEVMTGLKKEDLKRYGININKMKEVL